MHQNEISILQLLFFTFYVSWFCHELKCGLK